ncbi:MAG: hypothetical protein KJN84_02605 [Bacteroidia bacterium]|nr:hypothetical protein [Bacteroidia bacterium]
MSQLSKEEIQQIFDYTERMNTKYKDVQIEIVDHIASGIERAHLRYKDKTFARKLYEFTGELSNDFFYQIESSKRKGIEKQWWRIFWQSVIKIIHPPMVIAWILMSILFYFSMTRFGVEVESKNYIFLFWFEPFIIYYLWKTHKFDEHENNYLFIKIFDDTMFKIYAFVYLAPLIISHNIFDFFTSNSFVIAGYAIWYGLLSVILYIIFVTLPKKFSNQIETKYSHLNLNLS